MQRLAMRLVLSVFAFVVVATTVSSEVIPNELQRWERLFDPAVEGDRAVHFNQRGSTPQAAAIPNDADVVAEWIGAVPWPVGVGWGGETYFGSISRGSLFFGSTIANGDLYPVDLVISTTDTSLCQTFRRDLGYVASGVGTFPGAAYDMSDPNNPRRLNICFVEDAGEGAVNLTWDPSNTNSGKREYVFIMDTDYDGTGATYASANIFQDANTLPVVYAWWPRVATGRVLLQSNGTLEINPYFVRNLRGLPDQSSLTLGWATAFPGIAQFQVSLGITNPPPPTAIISGSDRTYEATGLVNGATYYYKIEGLDGEGNPIAESEIASAVVQQVSQGMSINSVWHGRGTYGDCWGYIDPADSTEYALICARNEGVSIIDINVDPPVEVGFMPAPFFGADAKDVKTKDTYAFVVNEYSVVQVFDITDVTAPVQIGSFEPDGGSNLGSHNCLIDGDYLYVIGNHGVGGLEIVDISDPANPVEIADFQPFYYHDIDVRNDTIAAAGIYGDGVDILDVTDKLNPQLVARFNYPGSGAHNCEFTPDGQHVFIGDEIGTGQWTRTFDISDMTSINMVSEIIVDSAASVHNCYIVDTFLYVAHYTEGIRVWSIADPANPYEVAYYDSYPNPGFGYSGCWTVYPFLPSGRIIASDMQTGLYVLNADFLSAPPSCCIGTVGNVDCDGAEGVGLPDLSTLIDNLFITFTPLCCEAEGNVDGSEDGAVSLPDLSVLIDHLFISFTPLAACE